MKLSYDMYGNKYQKKRKDRRDARRIQAPAVLKIMTYLKDRQDADVYINQKFDVTNLVKYMQKKKKENDDITYFHLFAAACAKIVYNKPKLNHYLINHNCYERDDVSVSFVAKVKFEDDAKEVLSVLKINPNDTIDNISKKVKEKVHNVRNNNQNGTDDSIDILNKIPTPILTYCIIPILRFMDRHDLLPDNLNNNLIYNSTVILSNLGSINCGAIYHNITNFGTNSILITFGNIHKEPIVIDNQVVIRDILDIGITIDERIADGFYFSKAINLLDYIFKNPELLEDKVCEKIKEK